MDIPTKIKMAKTYANISEAELTRRLSSSAQAFGQRLKTGKFTSCELERIAEALGAKFVCYFEFPTGEKI